MQLKTQKRRLQGVPLRETKHKSQEDRLGQGEKQVHGAVRQLERQS